MTSTRRFDTWRAALLAESPKKKKASTVTTDPSLLGEDGAVFMVRSSLKHSGNDVNFLHHITQLKKKDGSTIYVALAGLSSEVIPVEIDVEQGTQEVEVKAPLWPKLMTSSSENEEEAKLRGYLVQPLQLIPPSFKSALLESTDPSPEALLACATTAIQKHKKNDDSTKNAVAFLWHACHDKAKREPRLGMDIKRCRTSEEVLEWNEKLHQKHIEPVAAPPPQTKKKQRTWEESFSRLVAYQKVFGDCNCPREFKADPALGEWVKTQRSNQKTLSAERRANLESLDFTFSNTQQDRSNKIWEGYYQRLQKHVEENGDCRPKEDKALNHWVSVQRQNFKRKAMLEDRKRKLDELNFPWMLKNTYKARASKDDHSNGTWNTGYQKLLAFHKENGHINVPKRPQCNRPLWEFVYSQRKAYHEKRLTQERQNFMESLGMVWDIDNGQVMRDKQFNDKYSEAKAFWERHGHLEVPRSGVFGNTNLLKWLMRQREQYKNEKLPANRKKLLRDLDFDFEGNPSKRDKQLEKMAWKEGYGELVAYHKANGTVAVPEKASAKEKKLEKWLAKQKVADQFNDLDPARKKLLMELGVEFVAVSLETLSVIPKDAPEKKSDAPVAPGAMPTDQQSSAHQQLMAVAASEKQLLENEKEAKVTAGQKRRPQDNSSSVRKSPVRKARRAF